MKAEAAASGEHTFGSEVRVTITLRLFSGIDVLEGAP